MTNSIAITDRKPLRLWPALAIAGLQIAGVLLAPTLYPSDPFLARLGIVVGGALLTLLWWLLLSRAPWVERIGALALMVVLAFVAKSGSDVSIAGAGQGFLIYIMMVPLLAFALIVWAASTRRAGTRTRRVALVAMLTIACAPPLLMRTDGVGGPNPFHWRWTPTAEEILLAQGEEPVTPPPPPPAPAEPAKVEPAIPVVEKKIALAKNMSAPSTTAPALPVARSWPKAEWPGFRGPLRDGIIRNVRINTDWNAVPPSEIWRRPIGPGWSSFAVRGDLMYTQEQRGEDEMVSCYRVSTGQPVWRHRDAVRFYESNGGAGPRATPTIHDDRVFAHGATGILNALDAQSGKLIWTRNVAADTKREVPYWGIASSPLVIDDLVVVAAASTLAAYHVADGTLKWLGPRYGSGYSSPHRLTLDGVEQIVLLGGPGAISVNPSDGKVLWIHDWAPGPMVQPALTEDGDILVNHVVATGGVATRRLHVSRVNGEWKMEEKWTSTGLKPNFNDFVVHKGHAYGFDNNILASINLETGQRAWKGGRYGNGQLVLLQDQDVLLVTSEDGELALVSATPDKYTEIAKIRIFESKTWNHPVIVRDLLLVRNGEEMAAFKLPIAGTRPTEDSLAQR
ncbi:MAG TPA: PQQ-binding-like beta-propeller repeat protein [Vicinamibacterales bacterium]|nr:PQQ-binding-like beta-propeller repeat protein [Vicinamibacterales bacterium]